MGFKKENGILEYRLTEKDKGIIKMLSDGLIQKEIAVSLGVPYRTVEHYVAYMLRGLGMRNATELCCWAIRKGIIR